MTLDPHLHCARLGTEAALLWVWLLVQLEAASSSLPNSWHNGPRGAFFLPPDPRLVEQEGTSLLAPLALEASASRLDGASAGCCLRLHSKDVMSLNTFKQG